MDVTGNVTVLGQEPTPLDAGSLLFLTVTLVVFCGPLFVLFPPFPPRRSDALEETHNKVGVPAAQSGLRDEAAAATAAATSTGKPAGSIRSLFIYPVKSCRGVEVSRAKILPTGLELDRLFTLAQLKSPFPVGVGEAGGEAARAHTWEFITQRQFPRLATLEVEVWRPDLAKIKGFRDPAAGSSDEAFLVLRFPWRRAGAGPLGLAGAAWDSFAAKCTRGWRAEPQVEVVLPMEFPSPDEIARKGYAHEPVRVWGEEVAALNMGCELPEELRLYLGVSNKLALFRIDPERPREVHGCAPSREEAGYQPVAAFQDSVSGGGSSSSPLVGRPHHGGFWAEALLTSGGGGRLQYPVHIMNLASVRDLESKVTKDEELEELSPRRFRANIFGEFFWFSLGLKSYPTAVECELI